MNTWAKIRGAYVLSRRNIARIIAAIAAAILSFHTATTTLSPADEALNRRAFSALDSVHHIEESLPATESRVAVSDHVFGELSELFFAFRHLLPHRSGQRATRLLPTVNSTPRRYSTRKTISVAKAAEITGLGTTTIKRLDRDPKNTNYPGRNSTPHMLAAWARLYRQSKLAVGEVRAANRPCLGYRRT